jgi:hypothetical protein
MLGVGGFDIALLWYSLSLYLSCWFGGLLTGLHASSLIEGSRSVVGPVPPYRDYVLSCAGTFLWHYVFPRFSSTATVWCWPVLVCVLHFLLL